MPSAKEKVAAELRKAILSRQMKEGEILSLDSVASQLNVSAMPVREAFQILARDGLIKLRQNKGAIVLGITDTYIREHYQLRAILESACAGLAAEEGVDISGIRDSYEESKAALGKGDYSQYASQNRDFHSEIWAAAGNKKMENMNTAEVPGAGLLVWMEVRSMKSNYVILISLRQWDTSLYW